MDSSTSPQTQMRPITYETFACANETLADLRARLSLLLNVQSHNVQIYSNETGNRLLNFSNESKLLKTLGIDGMQPLNVKVTTSYPLSSSSLNNNNTTLTPVKDNSNYMFSSTRKYSDVAAASSEVSENERALPGFLIANDGETFEMLHSLEELGDANIKSRVRNILKLIPTNPKLLEAYERIMCQCHGTQQMHTTASMASFTTGSKSRH